MHINAFVYLLVYLTRSVCVSVCVCVCMHPMTGSWSPIEAGRVRSYSGAGPLGREGCDFTAFVLHSLTASGRLTSGPTALGAFGVRSSERLCSSQPLRFILPKLQGNYGNAPFEAGLISLYFLLPDKADLACLWWAFFFFSSPPSVSFSSLLFF